MTNTDTTSTTDDTTTDDGAGTHTALLANYLEAWNTDDAGRRRAAIEATWTPDHEFTDPLAAATGHDELEAFITQVRGHYPGSTFRAVSGVDAHHDVARWRWELVTADGAVAAVGHDAVQVADDGRIRRFIGFFGPPAPVA